MAKETFDAEPNVLYLILSKVLEAKRNKVSLNDRDRYNVQPGQFHIEGLLKYAIDYTVGEDSTTMRSYGVPLDTIILLSFLYAGAFREQLIRAALIAREIKTAELEERRVKGVRYVFDDVVKSGKGYKIVKKIVRVSAMGVAQEATRLGLRLIGVYPEFKDDPEEAQRRALIAEQIQNCLASIKVNRPYNGPINPENVTLQVLPAIAEAA